LFKWGAILGIVAALATSPIWYHQLFFRVEEEVRARVEAHLAAKFPHLEIHVRAAHLAVDGIEVRGLSISEPGAAGPQRELAYLETVFLTCRTSPQELLAGEPVVTDIHIGGPVVRATRRPDGSFSLAKPFPLPKPPCPPPTTTIENGTIEIFDPLKNPSSTFVLHDVDLTVKPAAGCDPQRPTLEVQGAMLSDHLRRLDLAGTIEPQGRWALRGTVDGLEISPKLRDALPEPLAARLARLSSLRAAANFKFHVEGDAQSPPRFAIDGSVAQGRIEDPLLPYPLTDVAATFHCDQTGLTITDGTARDGPALWEVKKYEQRGYAPRSPFVLVASGREVNLDPKWASTLPEPWSKYWRYYDPRGTIHLDCAIVFDGTRYYPTADARCLGNVSFSFHKFPYPFERSRGSLSLRDNVLSVAMTGYAGPQPVSFSGSFYNPGPQFTGWIEIQGDKIALDDKLFAAVLNPKSRDTLVALNPAGTINVFAKLWREDPNVRGMKQYARVMLEPANRCSITHDQFPYTLSSLQGKLELQDGTWKFENLVGTNGPGVVNLAGKVSMLPGDEALEVNINASNVPLVEDLRGALKAPMRRLWDALQPAGKIDATATVRFDATQRRTSVALRAFPRDDATSIGTSIEPVSFPYRMRLTGGYIDYQDGHAEVHNIHAVHGATQMRTDGSCDLAPEGGWRLQLKNLAVDRLRLAGDDHELATALPVVLRRAVTELKPGGSVNLKGDIAFAKARPDAPLHAEWNVDLMIHQGSLQAGPLLESIFGRVRLQGSSDGPRYASGGELDLDSLTYKNFQFTEIAGPLWFDNASVQLGAWVPARGQAELPARRVTAKLLGGTVAGDCQVRLGAVPQYHLAIGLSQADLGQFARENLAGDTQLQGKVAGTVELFGSRGRRSISGSGTIHLSEADVYKLPLMMALLKIARAKVPDSTAFTQSDIAFELQQGEHVILREINLRGDAIDLSGHGELKFDGHTNPIKLELHASGGRRGFPFDLLSEASRQILLIHVDGTLDHPITRGEPFPAANQALQQLQPDPDKPSLLQADGFRRALGLRR
jgi:hypothetical protein